MKELSHKSIRVPFQDVRSNSFAIPQRITNIKQEDSKSVLSNKVVKYKEDNKGKSGEEILR